MTIAANTTNFRQSLGRMGEKLAERLLLEANWTILERNFFAHRKGEIDIIARPPSEPVLAFIEVKTRDIKPWEQGLNHPGQMSIHALKQRRLMRAAMQYLMQHPSSGSVLRFDAILVDISLSRQQLNHLILLNDIDTLSRYARLTHLQAISGTF